MRFVSEPSTEPAPSRALPRARLGLAEELPQLREQLARSRPAPVERGDPVETGEDGFGWLHDDDASGHLQRESHAFVTKA